MKAVHLDISGTVQGVFFRQSTRQKAMQLGIRGWVRNCDDGTVEVEAEGEDETLEEFIHWCNRGPSGAKVLAVEVRESQPQLYKNFEVRR